MNLLIILVLFADAWMPLPAAANVRVHDGDTITVDFPGTPEVFGKDIGVRLLGIDTPELRDPDPVVRAYAFRARDYLTARVRVAKKLEVRQPSRDKYFRMGGVLIIDGIDVQKDLLNQGYAKPYDGGTKSPWTEADVMRLKPLNK